MMDSERKRKRPAEGWRSVGVDPEGRSRGSGAAGETAVAGRPAAGDNVEDEVEEFFAIVRRMHAAARQFSNGGMTWAGGGRMPRGEEGEGRGIHRWRPAFELEDFDEGRSHKPPENSDRLGEVASATSAPIAAAVDRRGRREETAAGNGTAVCLDLNSEPEPERVVG